MYNHHNMDKRKKEPFAHHHSNVKQHVNTSMVFKKMLSYVA